MRPHDHEGELEPGAPDPDDFCPVCWKHERDCQCPYDDCEPLKEKACLLKGRRPHEARGSAASNACYGAL
jgi:hypothetical protein